MQLAATTLEETPKAMIPASADAASNIGADVNIREEVIAAAKKAATGIYSAHVVQPRQLDRVKLISKVCAIVKSKRGLNEKSLPAELYDKVIDEVNQYTQDTFSRMLTGVSGLTYKESPVFRKSHETAPVAIKRTITAIREIEFKEQRLLLNVKLTDAQDKLKKAYALSNDERIAKWSKIVASTETMLAQLNEAELLAKEAAK